MSGIDHWILGWPTQSLARQPNFVFGAEVSVLGIDIDAISTDSLGIADMILFAFLSMWNQVFSFVVWIPADSV